MTHDPDHYLTQPLANQEAAPGEYGETQSP